MRRATGSRPISFRAAETIAVDRTAFSWRATFPLARLVSLTVVDEYVRGDGTLEARVLGLPVMRRTGPEITRGEALRYLAELPWAPFAMVHNPELEWRVLNEWSVEVVSVARGQPVGVQMQFDDQGDIVRASCPGRPREVGKRWVPTPWIGDFRDYASLGGMRIPTRAEVAWEIGGERFVYWRGQVTRIELLEDPFPPL